MPRLATPCGISGCPRLSVMDGRCEGHKRAPWQRTGAYPKGWAWERTRQRIIKRDGCCVYCGGPAEVVDHVIPRARGGSDDDANLRACCTRCNQRKAHEESRAGRESRRG